MDQQLTASASLAEDQSSVPSTYVVTHNYSSRRSRALFCPLCHCMNMVHLHMFRLDTFTKVKIYLLKELIDSPSKKWKAPLKNMR